MSGCCLAENVAPLMFWHNLAAFNELRATHGTLEGASSSAHAIPMGALAAHHQHQTSSGQ